MRAGLVFVLAVLALGGLAIADLTVASEGARSGYDWGGTYVTSERAVVARSVAMAPGDRLVVSANILGGFPTFSSYELHVVPGGDRFALLEGGTPRATYVHVAGMTTQGCCANGDVVWTRPDDALARRAPATGVLEPAPGEDLRAFERRALDQPDRVDLVWVFQYGPTAARPATADEEQALAQKLEASVGTRLAFQPAWDPAYPTVYRAWVAPAHAAMTWAMAALALVATGALAAWALALRRARIDAAAPGAESLLQAYDAAGAYLGTLRDLLLGSLVVLAAVALHVAILGEPQPVLQLLARADIGRAASAALGIALALAYAAVVVAWGYAVWSVHRALRRWRERRSRPPIDLAE